MSRLINGLSLGLGQCWHQESKQESGTDNNIDLWHTYIHDAYFTAHYYEYSKSLEC